MDDVGELLKLLGSGAAAPLVVVVGLLWRKAEQLQHGIDSLLEMTQKGATLHDLLVDIIQENTTAVKALTHYIQWLGKSRGLDDPPPPMGS